MAPPRYEHAYHDWTQFAEVYDTTLDIDLAPDGRTWVDDFAVKGPDMTVDPDLEKVMTDFNSAGKPIGLCCISPTLAAKESTEGEYFEKRPRERLRSCAAARLILRGPTCRATDAPRRRRRLGRLLGGVAAVEE